jgi:hypothetical protein
MVPEQVWDWHFVHTNVCFSFFVCFLSPLVWFFLWLPEEVLALLFLLHHENRDFSILMKDNLMTDHWVWWICDLQILWREREANWTLMSKMMGRDGGMVTSMWMMTMISASLRLSHLMVTCSCFFSSMMVISGAVSRGFLSYNMIGLIICVLALECHMCIISMCCYVK